MDSYAAWQLQVKHHMLASSADKYVRIERALKRLVGRRLRSVQLDALTGSSRLAFSGDLTLTTSTLNNRLRRRPHWLLRLPTPGSDNWPCVILHGTTSHSQPGTTLRSA
jgi:hypothetical protein